MIKLTNLLNEGRTTPISQEDFLEIYHTRFSVYKPTIYRGLKNADFKYGFVEPSQFTRRSSNTKNYYTFIVDNSEKWSKYPGRSKSLICSTSAMTADGFGDPYIIFFEHGSKLGVAPNLDFWHSFDKTISSILGRRGSLKSLNQFYDALFKSFRINTRDSDVKLDDSNFKSFKESFEELERKAKENNFFKRLADQEFTPRSYGMSIQDFSKEYIKSGKSLYEFIESLYDPEVNGFKLKTVKPDLGIEWDKEVWSDGNALLLRYELYEELEVRL